MSEPQVAHYTCIRCPIGCPLKLIHDGHQILEIEGQECSRGAKYARQEFIEPKRTFSTTIPIRGALYERLPVKLSAPIVRDKIQEAMTITRTLCVDAPVHLGQVLLRDVAGLVGVDIVACRTMDRVAR